MAPVDTNQIICLYHAVKNAYSQGLEYAIQTAVSTCLAGADGGVLGWLIGKLFKWAVGKAFGKPKKVALAVALRAEYFMRMLPKNVTLSNGAAAMEKAWNLTNKCGECHCIGHNRRNHPPALKTFLQNEKLLDDAFELAEECTEALTE